LDQKGGVGDIGEFPFHDLYRLDEGRFILDI
jgi:hypothetical protein